MPLIRALQALQILQISPNQAQYTPVAPGTVSKRKGKVRAYLTYPVTLLWYPRMEKTGSECYGGYTWAEESLLPGGTTPVIISNEDDDLVSVSELFTRADHTPTTATATANPTTGTHKRQISEAVPRDE